MKILNFGSCNIDFVYSVDSIVTAGETIATNGLELFPGGKGLNQSIATSRAGACVYHAGCLGYDGDMLEEILSSAGVNLKYLKKVDTKNGHAIIQVDKTGENCIFLYKGSNEMITEDFVDEVISNFDKGDFILLQNEINNLSYIIEKAYKKGLQIVLNPSPFNESLKKIDLNMISYLILNQIEGQCFTGKDSAESFLQYMNKHYPTVKVVLTLGKRGCIYSDSEQTIAHPCYSVKTVDTTGAGDTFIGYFVSSVASGKSYADSIKIASCASAIAVSRAGAAPSIPTIDEVEKGLLNLQIYDREKEKRQEILKSKLDKYLEDNLKTATLTELSKHLGYSDSYTGTVIKNIAGVSFSDYLQKKRCALAASMLLNTEMPIQSIINTVGYENESFFRKKFKEEYGLSPLKYRKTRKDS